MRFVYALILLLAAPLTLTAQKHRTLTQAPTGFVSRQADRGEYRYVAGFVVDDWATLEVHKNLGDTALQMRAGRLLDLDSLTLVPTFGMKTLGRNAVVFGLRATLTRGRMWLHSVGDVDYNGVDSHVYQELEALAALDESLHAGLLTRVVGNASHVRIAMGPEIKKIFWGAIGVKGSGEWSRWRLKPGGGSIGVIVQYP